MMLVARGSMLSERSGEMGKLEMGMVNWREILDSIRTYMN